MHCFSLSAAHASAFSPWSLCRNGLAPCLSSSQIEAGIPLAAAQCRGVRPLLSRLLTLKLRLGAARSFSTADALFEAAAQESGVRPSLSCESVSVSRIREDSGRSLLRAAAHDIGVRPSLSAMFAFAPFARSSSTMLAWLLIVAQASKVAV